jgi:hypothetical protein
LADDPVSTLSASRFTAAPIFRPRTAAAALSARSHGRGAAFREKPQDVAKSVEHRRAAENVARPGRALEFSPDVISRSVEAISRSYDSDNGGPGARSFNTGVTNFSSVIIPQ